MTKGGVDKGLIFIQEAIPEKNSLPGAVIAIKTFGDFLGFNPHCHILVTDGFHVFCGVGISPQDDTAMENPTRYIIRASLSQERMTYLDQEATVVYTSRDGAANKRFPALEWLAAMCSHIPNRGWQMVRYYGRYSNVSRGKRQMQGTADAVPCILEPQGDEKTFRKSWARLIQKMYNVDPLVCPKCRGTMPIISFIEDRQVIRAILEHPGIWLVLSKAAAENPLPDGLHTCRSGRRNIPDSVRR